MHPRTLLAALAGLALAVPALALDPSRAPTQYVRDQWQIEDGLPQSTVFSVVQDRHGYVWGATEEGIVRFDGVRFSVIDGRSSPHLAVPYVWDVARDEAGSIWAGTDRGGLLRIGEDGVERVVAPEELVGPVRALAAGRGGVMWAATEGGQVLRVTAERPEMVLTGQPPVRSLLEARDGTLWVGTNAGGLVRRAPDGTVRRLGIDDGLPGATIVSLYEDPTGAVWIGTNGNGVAVIRGDTVTSPDPAGRLAGKIVTAIAPDSDGHVWIGVHDGLFRHRDGRFEPVPLGGPVHVDSILEDREGNLWLGTQGSGLHRMRDGRVLSIGRPEGLPADIVWSTAEAKDGSVWMSLMGGGVTVLKDGAMRHLGEADGVPPVTTYALYADPEGGVWLGTEGRGAIHLHEGRARTYTSADGLVDSSVLSIVRDRRGRMWIGSAGRGISIQDGNGWKPVTTKEGLPPGYVFFFHEDARGHMWAGLNGGLAEIDPDGRVVRVMTTKDGLPDDAVIAAVPDEDGALWLATQRGLARMDAQGIASWTTKDGLYQDGALNLLDDGLGHLWMSSNKGIFRAAKADLLSVRRGEKASAPSLVIGRLDGMRTAECNGGFQRAGMRASDGRLWFPTVKGVVVVDPKSLSGNELPPGVAVEGVSVDGQPQAARGELLLTPGRHRVEIRYTGLALGVPERVRFRHRLDGWDQDWVDAGTERVAHFTGLRPGDYTFHVMAANEDGVWSTTAASLRLRQQPHFWQTWPFLLACGLLAAGGGFGAYRWRVRRLQARAEELERLVRERTRELAAEKEKSERLLLNVLPPAIAERLKHSDGSIADSFDEATVLFADIVGFTDMSSRMSAEALVEMLNDVFTSFDHLADAHHLEKIKTIGDAYMVVGGLPEARADHAEAVAEMALGMRRELARINRERGTSLDIRIGINTGPVVAGVIGRRKFIYDLWGDAVNTASRMESHGMPGEIQVSATTYGRLRERFVLESRGVITVKGKGEMPTWLLVGRRDAAPARTA